MYRINIYFAGELVRSLDVHKLDLVDTIRVIEQYSLDGHSYEVMELH